MRERPILFLQSMVRALLAGTKTQTRRIITARNTLIDGGPTNATQWARLDWSGYIPVYDGPSPAGNPGPYLHVYDRETPGERTPRRHRIYCRMQPGDRLWIRETFSGSIAYERLGYPLREWGNKIWYWADGNPPRGDWTKPRPSIHLPRALSRITLEITSICVERLQDISEADAKAEGCAPAWLDEDDGETVHVHSKPTYRRGYARLWRDLHGDDSWRANPWVWVIAFRRVDA